MKNTNLFDRRFGRFPRWRLPNRFRVRHSAGRLVAHLTLLILGLIFILPFLWMISSSLKSDAEIFRIPVSIIPRDLYPQNYPDAVTSIDFFVFLKNSAIYAILSTVGAVLSNAVVAYGFARIKWPGRDVVFVFVLATMMLPFQVRMIPLYVMFTKLGWLNTLLPLSFQEWLGSAFYLFLIRQFMLTLPTELEDAARIDGCSELGVFSRIVLPLSKPALTTVAIFQFLYAWNDYVGPLIYMRDPSSYPLSVGLQLYFTLHGAEWGLLMAASTLFALPVVLFFFFAQRLFIEGITVTGLKG